MIIPGEIAVKTGLIINLFNRAKQVQSKSVDLSLRRVQKWVTAGEITFNTANRAVTRDVQFEASDRPLHLSTGSYLVEFNESVNLSEGYHGSVAARYESSRILLSTQPLVNRKDVPLLGDAAGA